ncbi:PQQ-binding-like beta-propeller repeat protein [Streptomyces lichenis]|uniref:PQQ-binding-like beta-propeller repeat protein n=2 Tax=Streptomyces lichenis TaxID=2306967 RepID=A0ABT0IFP9_9ACTN|nr:PQQ-binding-like beta-propeller repeat protein [Streptomyces lichenis]
MSQPPNQQPPQGGFGPPEEPDPRSGQDSPSGRSDQGGQQSPAAQPPAGAPQPPAQPPVGPSAGAPQPPAQPPVQPPAGAPAGAPQPPAGPPPMPPQAPGQAPGQAASGQSGGYGTPQPGYGTPQPGYGAPQPGYGYPQTPPGQAPGPYGGQTAPGQAPGPYGAPTPPGQPPGQAPGPYGGQPNPYGGQPGSPYAAAPQPGGPGQQAPYPGAPGQPGGPYAAAPYPGGPGQQAPYPGGLEKGSPGDKGPFKGKSLVIVAAAVAALLVVGGGVWFAVGSGDDDPAKPDAKGSSAPVKPSGSPTVDKGDGTGTGGGRDVGDDFNADRQPGEAKVAFTVKNDVDLPRNGADVYGPWVVGDTVVKAMYKSVVGYSAADGTKKWEIPFATEVCTAPAAPTADGKIVIGLNDGVTEKADCNDLQQIDLNTGKAGWKKPVPRGDGFGSLFEITLAMSGDTVTAAGTGNSFAFSMADGKQLWGKDPDAECKRYAFAGGPRLIAAADCGGAAKTLHELSEVDAKTGKAKWSYRLPEGWEVDKVYSVSPLVVSAIKRDKKQWSVFALTDGGKLRSTIQGGKDKFRPQCGGSFIILGEYLQGCVGVAADASTFYMATEPTQLTRGTNEVVAFDLDTGKPKWRAKAGPERTMTPLRMEGSEVLVYLQGSYDRGGGVATLAPTGGAPKTLLQHPASTARLESSVFNPRYAYADGRFFIADGRVSASNDEEEKQFITILAYEK